MYSEIRRDPKVRSMPETFQLKLIWLLTLRSEARTEKMTREELMYGLDCDGALLDQLHATFLSKGFIDKDWSVKHWDKRQYLSDSSTPRVHKFRANQALKQFETFQKPLHETDQNRTDTETDKEKPVKIRVEDVENIYQAYPKKSEKAEALKAIRKALQTHDVEWLLEKVKIFAEQRKGEDPQFTKNPATWFNKGCYDDESLAPKQKWVEGKWEDFGTFDREKNAWVDANGEILQ